LLSEITTLYVPIDNELIILVVLVLVDQLYEYIPVPPLVRDVITPSLTPLHVGLLIICKLDSSKDKGQSLLL
jgi:hypothetical protein